MTDQPTQHAAKQRANLRCDYPGLHEKIEEILWDEFGEFDLDDGPAISAVAFRLLSLMERHSDGSECAT